MVLTVLSKALDDSAADHDAGSDEDSPSPAEAVVDEWNEGQAADSAEGVRCGNEALHLTLRLSEVCRV